VHRHCEEPQRRSNLDGLGGELHEIARCARNDGEGDIPGYGAVASFLGAIVRYMIETAAATSRSTQ
jgi:hypothetical protein